MFCKQNIYHQIKIFNQCNHRRRLHEHALFIKVFNKKTSADLLHMKQLTPINCYLLQNSIMNYNFVEKRPRCVSSLCFLNICSFHTTVPLRKMRKTREQKKFKNIIQFKPKSQQPIFKIWKGITVSEFATEVNRAIDYVFEAMGYIENCRYYNHAESEIHSAHILQEIAKQLGCRIEFIRNPHLSEKPDVKNRDVMKRPPPHPSELVKRPPIVTIMGHVDHGKTTLLDALRHTSVVKEEFGGITQHIGAFTVKVPQGQITFLDTPGHSAFKAMRSRGANVTDIVVLVVAGDDGIMEQTLESIRFANEARVPIIVAINKMDKAKSDAEAIKRELVKCGIQVEDLGGDIQSVCISALKKMNLNQLVEAILTQAEVMDVKGDPEGPVEGVILESSMNTTKGKHSTSLIQRGTLKKNSFLVSGTSWAKVKGMVDEWGKPLQEVKPGFPVRVFGWKSHPTAGDGIIEVASEKKAREIVEYRHKKQMEKKMEEDYIVIQQKAQEHSEKYKETRSERLMLGYFTRKRTAIIREKEIVHDPRPHLSFVLKGDVDGSLEAILDALYTYHLHDHCRMEIIHSGVGDVTENDIELAESFNGMIYCFNVGILPNVKIISNEKNVPVKNFNVIYHLIDDIKDEINKRLPLVEQQEVTGEAMVLQQFLINEGKLKVPVAGCKCIKGSIKKGSLCKVIRSDEVIHTGSILSLRHEKSDVETIKKDVECGLRLQDTQVLFLQGDVVACFNIKQVPQFTNWDPGF